MSTKTNMLEGHPGRVLFNLIFPMLAGAMGIVMFNLADTYFVGQLGPLPLAAMSFAFPVVMVCGSLAMGVGVGASSSIAQFLGAGSTDEAKRITTDAHLLGFALSILLALGGLIFMDPIFKAMGASDEVMPYISTYMTIWFSGLPLIILPMIGQNIIQATGDTKIPGLMLISAVTLNILLDPLLIFGLGPFPEMGIAGAAYATVLARGSIIIFTILIIGKREKLFAKKIKGIPSTLVSWRNILYVGLPAATINVMTPVSQGVANRLISSYGDLAVAGFGVATRLESFSLVFVIATTMVMTPFVGQNIGAKRPDRVRIGFRYSNLYALIWGALAFFIFFFFAHSLASIFNEKQEVVSVAGRYLTILALTYGFQGIVSLSSAAFNGLRSPLQAIGVSFTRLFLLYIPLTIAGKYFYGLDGIFVGAASANVISGIIGAWWFMKVIRKKEKHLLPNYSAPKEA